VLFASKAIVARVEASGKRLARRPRTTIRMFLEEFKRVVEAEAVNSFWESRSHWKLKKRAEKHGQQILAVFARARLAGRGFALRESISGTGFVDFIVAFSSGLPHVVELKILRGRATSGVGQLAAYMKQKDRDEGWLVFFDARKSNRKTPVPSLFKREAGTIRSVVIDINPIEPHALN
jgi:hypothetical protein